MPKPDAIPDCPPTSATKLTADRTTQEYRIELITPLFGGGVEAGVNDPQMPIRGTAIRGQLQFWWRATRGSVCATLQNLRERHRAVWGATDSASPVTVEVADLQASAPVPCAQHRWDPQARRGQGGWRLNWAQPFAGRENALPYVLFPFQGVMPQNDPQARSEEDPAACIHQASFSLRLRFPSALTADVEAAVWAWVNFGGLGARTRRGCGSLRCSTLAPADEQRVMEWFRKHTGELLGVGREWPVLPPKLLTRPEGGDIIDVWGWLAGLLRHFRQGEGFARNPGQGGRPGRSRYPEPETIRETTGANRGMSGHQRLTGVPADAFPRAEFGLPIVFHFQGRGEPVDTTLQPRRAERMASPLILKPLALADGRAIPIILPLVTPALTEIELLSGPHGLQIWDARAIRDLRLATYSHSPLAGLSRQGSAVEAFLNFARRPATEDGPGFVEITR